MSIREYLEWCVSLQVSTLYPQNLIFRWGLIAFTIIWAKNRVFILIFMIILEYKNWVVNTWCKSLKHCVDEYARKYSGSKMQPLVSLDESLHISGMTNIWWCTILSKCDDQWHAWHTVTGQFLETLSLYSPHHQFNRCFVMNTMILSEWIHWEGFL